jgi:hypothetical protein
MLCLYEIASTKISAKTDSFKLAIERGQLTKI